MNAIELLKNNHKMVLALIDELAHDIKQIEQTEQDSVDCDRMNMFGEFRDTLTQHTKLEEQILYPELAGSSETRLLVDGLIGSTSEFVRSWRRWRTSGRNNIVTVGTIS